MSIIDILQAIIGFALALFVPGYLLVRLLFKTLNRLEEVALGIAFSMFISISLGIALGYNKSVASITGGITAYNVWFYMLIMTAVLGTALIIKELVYKKDGKGSKKVSKK